MKKVYFTFLICFVTFGVFAQTRTLQTTGFWDEAANWSQSNVPDEIGENVAFNNTKEVTIRDNSTYNVGSVDLSNQNALTIESGSRLNVGEEGNLKLFTTNNNAVLYVYGALYIYGDLVVHNNLTLVVTGTMVVSGNVVLNNNASIDVSGDMAIGGNFIGGDNTSMNVDGTVAIGGSIAVGNGSTLTGSGTVTAGGDCTGDPDFCGSTTLPVELLYFTATGQAQTVELSWAAAKAWDFSHYELERSANGQSFEYVATIDAEENTDFLTEFSYSDGNPLSGTSYYRLKAVDIDGKYAYKGIEVVQFIDKTFEVYPNPVTNGTLNISSLQATEGARLVLRDHTGRTVRSLQMSGREENITTAGLPAGLYILLIQSPQQTIQSQVLIR